MPEFIETAVLIDVMDNDHAAAREKLADFTYNELSDLSRNAGSLQELADAALRKLEML